MSLIEIKRIIAIKLIVPISFAYLRDISNIGAQKATRGKITKDVN